MTIKQFLSQTRDIDAMPAEALARMRRLRAAAEMVPSRKGEIEKALAECEAETAARVARLVMLRRDIAYTISLIGDAHMERVLELRYLDRQSWQRIAMKMHYDRSTVIRLHNRAIAKIATLRDENGGMLYRDEIHAGQKTPLGGER